jgi:hypothetical protein
MASSNPWHRNRDAAMAQGDGKIEVNIIPPRHATGDYAVHMGRSGNPAKLIVIRQFPKQTANLRHCQLSL